jgi:hypothetical protein
MKRMFLALVSLAALTGTAAAADLPPRMAPQPYYKAPVAVPVYNWTGFYIGINGGGGFGSSTWDRTGSFHTSGGLVGGTVGYNYQFGQGVVGLEGDIDWANINGTTNTACPFGCKTSDHWLSTVRGRLGYAADRFMPFVTGGAAFGDRIRHRRQLDRQGRISLRQPRQAQLRPVLRSRCDRQRVVHHQHRARRRQLPVLIAAANVQRQTPGPKPRGFLF